MMKPRDLTPEFVVGRANALKNNWSKRNTRMDTYEDIYDLDVWEGSPEEGERRVASPRAFSIVETARTLLLSQPPVISVPPSEVKRVAIERANKIEKYLYGAWHEMRMMRVLDDGDWYANCLGQGIVRIVYNPMLDDLGEFPLVAQALDPRDVYFSFGSRPGEILEAVHRFDRPRREINDEWRRNGKDPLEFDGPSSEYEAWLDEAVDYIDYWRVDIVQEEIEEEALAEEEPPLGVVGRVFRQIRGLFQEEEEGEKKPEPGPSKVWRRKITNCVVADGTWWIKKPVYMPGYEKVPFITWAGISTPRSYESGYLSVLYPVTAGAKIGESDVSGIIGAENQLLSMEIQIVKRYANGAILTDDPDLEVDWHPGATNIVREGKRVEFLVPPGPHPAISELEAKLQHHAEDSTFPGAIMGRYVGDLSGIAMSMLTNPVLMKVARRQQEREEAFARINEIILSLTEQWSPSNGWLVYGENRQGLFEAILPPAEIGGYRRNDVKLSASLPKDVNAELMVRSQMVDKRQLSRRSLLEFYQTVTRAQGISPEDEIALITVEDALLGNDMVRKARAMEILREYDAALAAQMEQEAIQQPPPPAPPQRPLPSGPMEGIPPQAVSPYEVPPQMGLEGMMGMQPGAGLPDGRTP